MLSFLLTLVLSGPAASAATGTCAAGNQAACVHDSLVEVCSNADLVRCSVAQTPPGKDPEIVAAFRKACTAGVPSGCSALAWMGSRNRGDAKDASTPELRDALYGKACDGGDPAGCYLLGVAHLGKYVGDAPKDAAKAAAGLKKACDAKFGPGCLELASLWEDGEAKPSASGGTPQILGVACDAGEGSACTWLGELTALGKGVAKDPARAKELYAMGCNAAVKHPLGCTCAADPARCAAGGEDTPDSVGSPGFDCATAFAAAIPSRGLVDRDLRWAWEYLHGGSMPAPAAAGDTKGFDPAREPKIKELAAHLQALDLAGADSEIGARPPRIVAGDLLLFSLAFNEPVKDAVIVARGNLDPVRLRLPATFYYAKGGSDSRDFPLNLDELWSPTRGVRPGLRWLRLRDKALCTP